MTHPLPLTDTPVFAGMMNDPRFGELARELEHKQPTLVDPDSELNPTLKSYPVHTTWYGRRSTLAGMGHPENCPACSSHQLCYIMQNPRPPLNRGLALPPGSAT